MKKKLFKYEIWLKPKKCRPAEYISDFFEAEDFWDANKFVHDFVAKLGVLQVYECKIREV